MWESTVLYDLAAAHNLSDYQGIVNQAAAAETMAARFQVPASLMCDSPGAQAQALRGLEWMTLAVRAVSEAGYQFLERWGCLMSVSLLKSEKSTKD